MGEAGDDSQMMDVASFRKTLHKTGRTRSDLKALGGQAQHETVTLKPSGTRVGGQTSFSLAT